MGDVWLNEAQWRNRHTISHLSSLRHCCRPTHTRTQTLPHAHTQTQRRGEMSLKWEPWRTSIQPSISTLGKNHSRSIFFIPNQCHILYATSQTALETLQPASISSEPTVQPLTWLITCFIKAVTTLRDTHTHVHYTNILIWYCGKYSSRDHYKPTNAICINKCIKGCDRLFSGLVHWSPNVWSMLAQLTLYSDIRWPFSM